MWYQKLKQNINRKIEVKNGGKSKTIHSSVQEVKNPNKMKWV